MCLVAANSVETSHLTSFNLDKIFLDNLTPAKQETVWSALIQPNIKQISFKLDKRAEVTAISENFTSWETSSSCLRINALWPI